MNSLLFNQEEEPDDELNISSGDSINSSNKGNLLEKKRPRGAVRELTETEKRGMKDIEEND